MDVAERDNSKRTQCRILHLRYRVGVLFALTVPSTRRHPAHPVLVLTLHPTGKLSNSSYLSALNSYPKTDELELSSVLGDTRAYLYSPLLG